MNGWIIALIVFVVIVIFLVLLFHYIKKKVRNTIIDKGAEIVTAATENVLDKETAGKVNEVTNVAADILKKSGTDGFVKAAVKKGIKMAVDKSLSKE